MNNYQPNSYYKYNSLYPTPATRHPSLPYVSSHHFMYLSPFCHSFFTWIRDCKMPNLCFTPYFFQITPLNYIQEATLTPENWVENLKMFYCHLHLSYSKITKQTLICAQQLQSIQSKIYLYFIYMLEHILWSNGIH